MPELPIQLSIPKPKRWKKVFWTVSAYTVLMLGLSLSTVATTYFVKTYLTQNSWVLLIAMVPGLWITGLMFKSLEHRHLDKKWKNALEKWYGLFFCGNCGIVFEPSTSVIKTLDEVQDYLQE